MKLNKKTVHDFIWNYWIVGVITNQGEVLSTCDNFETIQTHVDYYPLIQKRWRWDYQNGITCTYLIEKEDWELIRNHLRKKYNIPFWDNGYHDIDYFQSLKPDIKKIKEKIK